MTWGSPWFFLAFLILPLMIWQYLRKEKKPVPTVTYPLAQAFVPLMKSPKRYLRHLPFVLRFMAVAFIIVALARPRLALDEEKVHTQGIDLIIAIDISTSMLAEDLDPDNRLEAAKMVAKEFISGRESDRIGLVMFAGEAFTWAPLTLDYDVLASLMDQVEAGSVTDGTGIGKAIAAGVNRLRKSDAKSKVLILLTDGVNNVDQPDPLTAARAATELGVKVYTIGVGTRGQARAPVQDPYTGRVRMGMVQVEIDEELLTKIADMTGGMYFRATSTDALRNIYKRIDELETVDIEVEHIRRFRELFYRWALLAFVLVVLERILVLTRLRNLAW